MTGARPAALCYSRAAHRVSISLPNSIELRFDFTYEFISCNRPRSCLRPPIWTIWFRSMPQRAISRSNCRLIVTGDVKLVRENGI